MVNSQRQHQVSFCTVLLLFVFLTSWGCASIDTKSMTPKTVNLANHHPHSVQIEVLGGAERKFLQAKEIPLDMFKMALSSSIGQFNAFSSVVSADADYLLEITIYGVDMVPVPGKITEEYTLFANWKLIDTESGSVEFQKRISSSCTPSTWDGAGRFTTGPEGAARENIAKGLWDISQLDFTK